MTAMTTGGPRLRSLAASARVPVLGLVLAAALGAFAARQSSSSLTQGAVLIALPALPLLFARRDIAAVLAIALLPYEVPILGAEGGSAAIASSDVLLVVSLVGIAFAPLASGELAQRLNRLRPLVPLLLIYAGGLAVSAAAHFGTDTPKTLLQRAELIVGPLLIAACTLTERVARKAAAAFIVVACVLAVAWIAPRGLAGLQGEQKNPAGGFLADGALLALTVARGRLRLGAVALLTGGVFATQSRGALLGLLVGLLVVIALRSPNVFAAAARALPITLLLGGLYVALPQSYRNRLAGEGARTVFSDNVRRAYIANAKVVIKAHPLVGIGPGNYLTGSPTDGTQSDDPHNVYLLEAAEGGAALFGPFMLLQLGSLALVFRRRKRTPWALPAMAVQVCTLTHAGLDVYWVRGTPVLGFLLVGMAIVSAETAVLE